VYFPKWGIAEGREQIGRMFGGRGQHPEGDQARLRNFNWVFSGGDTIVAEGTS